MGEVVSLRAEAKTEVGSSRFPATSLMVGDLRARETAEGEAGLRVRARISKSEGEAWRRRAVMTEEPCLPVAPVMRMARVDIVSVVLLLRLLLGRENWERTEVGDGCVGFVDVVTKDDQSGLLEVDR